MRVIKYHTCQRWRTSQWWYKSPFSLHWITQWDLVIKGWQGTVYHTTLVFLDIVQQFWKVQHLKELRDTNISQTGYNTSFHPQKSCRIYRRQKIVLQFDLVFSKFLILSRLLVWIIPTDVSVALLISNSRFGFLFDSWHHSFSVLCFLTHHSQGEAS